MRQLEQEAPVEPASIILKNQVMRGLIERVEMDELASRQRRISYEPTLSLSAVSAAGWLLSRYPESPLLDTSVRPMSATDTGQITLAAMINDSIVRPDYSGQLPLFKGYHGKIVDPYSCSSAEKYFIGVLKPDTWVDTKEFASKIYFDGTQPIFFNKSRGEPTALTLSDIAIDNVRYPAGSIVKLHPKWSARRKQIKRRDALIDYRDIDEIASIRFLRLSVFALSKSERLEKLPSSVKDLVVLSELQQTTPTSIIEQIESLRS